MIENTSVVEELWNGDLQPQEERGRYEEEIADLDEIIAQNRRRLLGGLEKEGREWLERYDEAIKERAAMREGDVFVNAFRLGMRIASECLLNR